MTQLRFPAINQVAISGKLSAEPEFRQPEADTTRCLFQVAVNRPYRDDNDEWQQETSFVPVSVQGKLAEMTVERLTKGSSIFLTGRLASRPIDGPDGKRVVLEVFARHIQFLDKKEGNMETPLPF